ncbi:MAG TPA: hypothetical protein VE631_03820 [Alphaproteobacteria bacterium]|nr:hypothetical protein [Alphaproteobacteria bacterium]
MTPRAFRQFLMTWLYLNLAGATIILFDSGPHERFWILLLSAMLSWLALGRSSQANSGH